MKRGLPVTISTNGLGMPVTPVTKGAPLATVSDNGRGQPIVLADHGQPFVFAGDDLPKLLFAGGKKGTWLEMGRPLPTIDDVLLDLFQGKQGVWLTTDENYTPERSAAVPYLYQDAAGTMPVTSPGDPVGLIKRIAGTADAVQAVGAARATYQDGGTPRVVLDKVDDNYEFDFTGSGGFEATWYQGSKEGLVKGKLLIPDGVWKIARSNPNYFPSDNVMGLIIVEGEVSESMDAAIRQWFADRGCGMDFGTMTSFRSAFSNRQDVIALDCVHWDTSSVTDFYRFAADCSSLVVLDVSNWDTSSVTSFSHFAFSCSSLVTLDTSNWDTSSVTDFERFVRVCSSLVSLDTSSWDTSSVTSFAYFAADCSSLTTVLVAPVKSFSTITSGSLAGIFQNTNLTQESIDNILVNLETCAVDNGTFGQSGGSAPSAIGEAAIDALRGRGWTITVTGGY